MDKTETITVTANGKSFTVPDRQSLEGFLEQLGFAPGMVVVERNREPVSPSETDSLRLENGDALEIVQVVAGG